MDKKKLQIEQLERRLSSFSALKDVSVPPMGWLKYVRISLGMTMQQLASRLLITRQSIQEIEQREREGSITLRRLQEVASALDMQLVYGFIPKDGSVEQLIDRKAHELASSIIVRSSNTMKLEDQEVSTERLNKALKERIASIKNTLPKTLWD